MPIPHKCPVCGGTGNVPECFYDDCEHHEPIGGIREICQSCGGTGIVWESRTVKSVEDVIMSLSFREQGLFCRDHEIRFEERCHICSSKLLMCKLYSGFCMSSKCRTDRIRLFGTDEMREDEEDGRSCAVSGRDSEGVP